LPEQTKGITTEQKEKKNKYIYIYIYISLCVCVCVGGEACKNETVGIKFYIPHNFLFQTSLLNIINNDTGIDDDT
jgi:hypothetical protein